MISSGLGGGTRGGAAVIDEGLLSPRIRRTGRGGLEGALGVLGMLGM